MVFNLTQQHGDVKRGDNMQTEEELLRGEVQNRIQRETHYVLAMSVPGVGVEQISFLKEKIADNDKTISLIGKFLESKGSEWEKFYRENYWDKKV